MSQEYWEETVFKACFFLLSSTQVVNLLMGILLTVAVTHPENVPTIDLQYEVIDHYFASDRMSGERCNLNNFNKTHVLICNLPSETSVMNILD